jgi:hypothetical protein
MLGTAATLFLVIGLAMAYVYQEKEAMKIPLMFLTVTFIVLSMRHITRYMLPFVPMALVVAGHGVDRIRHMISTIDRRAALVVFVGILAVSGGTTYQYTNPMVTLQAQRFTGLEEAGKWIRANTAEDVGVIAGSGHQSRFFADRPTWHAANVDNRSHMEQLIREQNYRYMEVDRWERTQPEWFQQTLQSHDAYQPVHAEQRQGQPIVVVYQVDPAALD